MKIAIFHDFLGSIGGGEKLVLELASSLKADIITTEVDKKNLERMNIHKVKIINLGNCSRIPIIKQIHSSWLFHKVDYHSKYDFFIMSGNWSVFAAKRHKPNIYYIHTPVRMFYDSKKEFYKIAPWYAKIPFLIWVGIHGHYVQKQFKYVDKIIANSKNVQKRIKRYHGRDSRIINPPISQYGFKKYGDYWLSVNRIYPHKRIGLQIDVFRELPDERLIIVGGHAKGDHSDDYSKKVFKDMPSNVLYLGEVSEQTLQALYEECKAFITTSKDEDFGMTVLEANSAGKAVVATDEGGYKETVINSRTGYLVRPEKEHIKDAIIKVSKNPSRYKNDCMMNARKYRTEIFIRKMESAIDAASKTIGGEDKNK